MAWRLLGSSNLCQAKSTTPSLPPVTMIIDHIAIVVRSLEQAIPHWERTFGYTPMTSPVVNSRQRVRVVFWQKTDPSRSSWSNLLTPLRL